MAMYTENFSLNDQAWTVVTVSGVSGNLSGCTIQATTSGKIRIHVGQAAPSALDDPAMIISGNTDEALESFMSLNGLTAIDKVYLRADDNQGGQIASVIAIYT